MVSSENSKAQNFCVRQFSSASFWLEDPVHMTLARFAYHRRRRFLQLNPPSATFFKLHKIIGTSFQILKIFRACAVSEFLTIFRDFYENDVVNCKINASLKIWDNLLKFRKNYIVNLRKKSAKKPHPWFFENGNTRLSPTEQWGRTSAGFNSRPSSQSHEESVMSSRYLLSEVEQAVVAKFESELEIQWGLRRRDRFEVLRNYKV